MATVSVAGMPAETFTSIQESSFSCFSHEGYLMHDNTFFINKCHTICHTVCLCDTTKAISKNANVCLKRQFHTVFSGRLCVTQLLHKCSMYEITHANPEKKINVYLASLVKLT